MKHFRQAQEDGRGDALGPGFKFPKLFWSNVDRGGYIDTGASGLPADGVEFLTYIKVNWVSPHHFAALSS